jgi:hypothetical protein
VVDAGRGPGGDGGARPRDSASCPTGRSCATAPWCASGKRTPSTTPDTGSPWRRSAAGSPGSGTSSWSAQRTPPNNQDHSISRSLPRGTWRARPRRVGVNLDDEYHEAGGGAGIASRRRARDRSLEEVWPPRSRATTRRARRGRRRGLRRGLFWPPRSRSSEPGDPGRVLSLLGEYLADEVSWWERDRSWEPGSGVSPSAG